MSTWVTVDCISGELERLEIGGSAYRKTHRATPKGGPTVLTPRMIEQFRVWPDPEFSLDPPPRPTNPPASAGRIAA